MAVNENKSKFVKSGVFEVTVDSSQPGKCSWAAGLAHSGISILAFPCAPSTKQPAGRPSRSTCRRSLLPVRRVFLGVRLLVLGDSVSRRFAESLADLLRTEDNDGQGGGIGWAGGGNGSLPGVHPQHHQISVEF